MNDKKLMKRKGNTMKDRGLNTETKTTVIERKPGKKKQTGVNNGGSVRIFDNVIEKALISLGHLRHLKHLENLKFLWYYWLM